jgi:hypothetical protein
MEPLDKLEIILKGIINQRQKELDRAEGSKIPASTVYLYSVVHENIGLERALYQIIPIKQGSFTDEMAKSKRLQKITTL